MKKQILIIGAVVTSIAFVSCSKEKSDATGIIRAEEPTEEINAQKPAGDRTTLNKNLECWFPFNGNLDDKTGKRWISSSYPSGTAVYTSDRNGIANSAVKFNGRYTLAIPAVPHSTTMSLAAWVKYDSATTLPSVFMYSLSDGPMLMHGFDQFYGYNNPTSIPYVASGSLNNQWHYLVVTIDGTLVKLYVDGVLIGSKSSPDTDNQASQIYLIGSGNNSTKEWQGAVDDLRIYTRTLSAAEVQTLFNLNNGSANY